MSFIIERLNALRRIGWYAIIALIALFAMGCGGSGNPGGTASGPPELSDQMRQANMALFSRSGEQLVATLKPGWNFVAIPWEPQEGSSVTGGKVEVWKLQAHAGRLERMQDMTSASDLLKLAPGTGVWVRAESETTITLVGATSAVSILLVPGWNNFGVLSETPVPLESVRIATEGRYEPLLQSGAVRLPIYAFDSTSKNYVAISASTDTLKPGTAYWVFANASVELACGQVGFQAPLAIAPAIGTTNGSYDVTFRIGLADQANLPVTGALEELRDGTFQQVGEFTDTGNAQVGDDIPNDRQYYARISISSATARTLTFRARFVLQGPNGDNAVSSNTVQFRFIEQISEGRASDVVETASNIQTQLESLAQTSSVSEAVQVVWSEVKKRPDVQASGISSSGTGVWWVTTDGIPCAANAFKADQKGGRQSVRPGGKPVRGTPLAWDTRPTFTSSRESNPNLVGNRKVLCIAAFNNEFGAGDDVPNLFGMIQALSDPDLDEVLYVNEACTLDVFRSMRNFGSVLVSSHGDSYFSGFLSTTWGDNSGQAQVAVLTREPVTIGNLISNLPDLITGRLVVCGEVFAITPGFVREYCAGMPNSLVYMSACRSSFNASMANAFLGAGAGAYFGYSDYVGTFWSRNVSQVLFEDLLEGKTTGESFIPGQVETDSDPARFDMFGNSKLVMLNVGLINGSFEDGLNGWDYQGDARVIPQLGPLAPQHEQWFAIISTGLGAVSDSNSYVRQRFKVPNDAVRLVLWYDVISEEPMEYVNSQFDDQVLMQIGEGTPTTFVFESVNTSTWSPISNIDFPGGDSTTFHTIWRKVESVDLTAFRGKYVTLMVQCFDKGDSIFDTAVILDGVAIEFDPKP